MNCDMFDQRRALSRGQALEVSATVLKGRAMDTIEFLFEELKEKLFNCIQICDHTPHHASHPE